MLGGFLGNCTLGVITRSLSAILNNECRSLLKIVKDGCYALLDFLMR